MWFKSSCITTVWKVSCDNGHPCQWVFKNGFICQVISASPFPVLTGSMWCIQSDFVWQTNLVLHEIKLLLFPTVYKGLQNYMMCPNDSVMSSDKLHILVLILTTYTKQLSVACCALVQLFHKSNSLLHRSSSSTLYSHLQNIMTH